MSYEGDKLIDSIKNSSDSNETFLVGLYDYFCRRFNNEDNYNHDPYKETILSLKNRIINIETNLNNLMLFKDKIENSDIWKTLNRLTKEK